MSAHLFLTTNIKTAIAHLLNRLSTFRSTQLLMPVSILLPSIAVIQDLRRLLGDSLGVKLFQFYLLGNAVLDEAGIPIHQIDDTTVRRLIRNTLAELSAEGLLTSFAPVWEKPGFAEVILDWVREMKSQGIFPVDYEAYALDSGSQRDLQLAALYTRYQIFLQQQKFSDPDGLLWLAAEVLENDPGLFRKDQAMYILGFDQFTPVQIRILRQLEERGEELNLYLLWDENRSAGSLPLARLQRTRDALLANIPMQIQTLAALDGDNPSLTHLQSCLFEPGHTPLADEGYIRLIEAPSRESEVRAALRTIKQLLLDGISPADITLLAPQKATYLPILRTVAAEYELPVGVEQNLLDNPAVAALVNLLALPPTFPWQATFETLRSPYFRQSWLSLEQIDTLDRLSRERPVIAGREQWEFAVRPLDLDVIETDDEDLGEAPLVATLEHEELAAIGMGMAAYFDHLTPPEKASYQEYTWWLQTAILGCFPESENSENEQVEDEHSLDLLGSSREGPFSQRDLVALNLVLRAARRLMTSADIILGEVEVTWETYRNELINLLGVMQIPLDPLQPRVRFEQLEEGRSHVSDYLFVIGLSEGEFPTAPPADPLYAPREREAHPLPLFRFTPADDASLWWQLLSNVDRKLFLLRTYIDENGAPWQASPYWDAVTACFADLQVERIPIAQHPEQQQAASLNELLVALAQSGATAVPFALNPLWTSVQTAERVMNLRLSYEPPGLFEGIIQSETLRAELDERYDERYVWSASRLNRYSNCPYGFFAEQVLKLTAQPEPEEGMDVLQRGSLLHAILERLYQSLADQGVAPIMGNLDRIITNLQESCEWVYQSAPQRYGFRPGALWEYEQQELFRLLQALVTWECGVNQEDARFLPYLQEVEFGIGKGLPALEVDTEAARFSLRGMIDRIDRDSTGNLRIVDYKSDSSAWTKPDLQKGLAFQTTLYALAAEQYFTTAGGRVAESEYWHIPNRKKSGSLEIQGAVRENELAEAIIQQAGRNIAFVRAGIFPSAPGKSAQGTLLCSSQCDFGSLCRVTRSSIAKARRAGQL